MKKSQKVFYRLYWKSGLIFSGIGLIVTSLYFKDYSLEKAQSDHMFLIFFILLLLGIFLCFWKNGKFVIKENSFIYKGKEIPWKDVESCVESHIQNDRNDFYFLTITLKTGISFKLMDSYLKYSALRFEIIEKLKPYIPKIEKLISLGTL